jgi:hypothetical protein
MREVSPGDIIFSFRDTRIAALGIARSYCYESPKPTEFGTAGSYWEATAKKVDVSFRELTNRIHPKSHISELRGLLPQKYSPLRANGDGLQSVLDTALCAARSCRWLALDWELAAHQRAPDRLEHADRAGACGCRLALFAGCAIQDEWDLQRHGVYR